ncbi:hypothetical protein DL89DRAFT_265443 [Linderina pennispora]|uniref:Uncharacterized protein n=1 Tax=Linderina pennispora TaxID=61395 RepID=A0A1Y1WIQ9_9FUNG|nr:uncharacterized protein DL89DRAFT_265443 [Linderina pennispora]ORX73362.1 hypothetical protein DL89DRAFT_265443 [Linderina pennispora]
MAQDPHSFNQFDERLSTLRAQRQLRNLTVFRVIVAMQELLFQYIEVSTNTGCRILTTLALLVFIYVMPKSARWIRISMVIVCAALSVVPECFPLFIPPSAIGIQSGSLPTSGILLATIVGIVSMAITLAGLSDSTLYMEQRRHRTSVLVVRTLKSVVWFPVIPIVALGFTTAYSIVQYKTGRRTHSMECCRPGIAVLGRAAVPLELVSGEMESRLSRMELHTFVR